MTVTVQDSFNRTGANLGSNPSGRFSIPVGDFALDGQVALTDSTVAASTSPFAFAYGLNPGVNYGEWRVTAARGTAQVKAIGVLARCHISAVVYDRYWFGWTNESGTEKFELRIYSSTTLYLLQNTITAASLGITGDLNAHVFKLRITRHGTSNMIDIVAKYDGYTVFNIVAATDFLTALGASAYRTPGFQCTTSSAWVGGTDFATFDLVQFDDLETPTTETAPALVAEPTLSASTLAGETTGIVGLTQIDPDHGEIVDERYFVNRARSEAGYETTFAKFTIGRRLWRVRWTTISTTDLASVLAALYGTSNGTYTYYPYPAPDGTTYKTRFVDGTVNQEQVAPNVYNLDAVLEELQ